MTSIGTTGNYNVNTLVFFFYFTLSYEMKLSCFTISVYISENLKYTQPKMNLKVWYTFNDDVQLLQISFNLIFLTQNDP